MSWETFTASVSCVPLATFTTWRWLLAAPTDTVLARSATAPAPSATLVAAFAVALGPMATARVAAAAVVARSPMATEVSPPLFALPPRAWE